ncbi:MAG: hypothetical protein AAB554_04890 [Patescibacteria group bacterium]
MAARTLPRLPKLPKLAAWRSFTRLSGFQALLLLGGAFVFASVAFVSSRYDVIIDRTAAVPESSVLAATITDRFDEHWPAFESRLPEKARQALSRSGNARSVTIFAVHGPSTELDWSSLEELGYVTERTGRKRLRLIPHGTSAVGFVILGDRRTPFEAKIERGMLRARVGRDFRGLSLVSNPFDLGRRQISPLHMQSAYLEKPSGVSWVRASAFLSAKLQRFQALAGLWSLPGRMEMSISASETSVLNPFILYYRPAFGTDRAGPAFESIAKAILAETDPISFEVSLPDDSKMLELRREPDSVLTVRKKVSLYGNRAKLKVPGGRHNIEIFYADNGESWMSDDLGRIQASIMSNVTAKKASEPCESGGNAGFASFTGKSLDSWPFFHGFDRLTFTINNIESGMFTTCGYFTP